LIKITTQKTLKLFRMTNSLFKLTKPALTETNVKTSKQLHLLRTILWRHVLPILVFISVEMLTQGPNLKRFDAGIYVLYYLFDICYFYIITYGYVPGIFRFFKRRNGLQEIVAATAIPIYGILLILYNGFVCLLTNGRFEIPFDIHTLQKSCIRGVMICALAYAVAYARYAIRAEKMVSQQKLHALRLENNLLSVQTNPHLINNVLNYVYERVHDYSIQDAKAIALLCEITSDALTETDGLGRISLKQEVTYIEKYLQLNALYKESDAFKNIRLSFDGYESIKLPPKILLEPIVNLFKYGDLNNEAVQAQVILEVKDCTLQLVTRNAKKANHKAPSHKIGLKNLRQRLELNYPDHHLLVIHDTDHFFELTLTIKLC